MPRTHLLVAIAAATLGSFPLRAAQSTAAGPAPFELPAPTGPYPVGTTTWRLTDSARKETFDGSGAPRSVEVLAWYPAAGTEGAASALPTCAKGWRKCGRSRRCCGHPRTCSTALEERADARRARRRRRPSSPQKFPVLVFSHGYTGIRAPTRRCSKISASHGYAVLSVVHPYEATAATLADGRVVSLLDGSGKLVPGVRRGLRRVADRGRDDGSGDESHRRGGASCGCCAAISRGLNKTGVALQRWVDDTKLVLDRSRRRCRRHAGRPAARRAST